MNIFVLSRQPGEAARLQCDRHVVKMTVETAQLLSTAHRLLDGTMTVIEVPGKKKKKHWRLDNGLLESVLYKATHRNHPCSVWLRSGADNYRWLYEHFIALCDEYRYRYGKIHKCDMLFRGVLDLIPERMPAGSTEFVAAFKNQIAIDDIVLKYRAFYITKQSKFKMTWKNREVPEWFK